MAIVRWQPLSRWEPFKDLVEIQEEMNRIFENFFTGRAPERRRGRGELARRAWTPAIDVYETKDNIIVKTDLPGLRREDIDISILGDTLIIKGEKKQESEVKEEDCYRLERLYGAFRRQIPLPPNAKTESISATYKDGVLEVSIPKLEEAKPKSIEIKVS